MANKLIPIPYCIFIIKPHVAVNEEKVEFHDTNAILQRNQVLDLLNKNEFDVIQSLQKKLTKQEISNLFNKHKDAEFYRTIEDEMISGESLELVLTNRAETKFDEEKKEEVKVADPIERIKKLIGDKDPEVARSTDPNLWRAIYGIDMVCNGFYTSDNAKEANREREIFHFPVPQKIPEFHYEKQKLVIEDLLKFVFPPNLEHSNSTGRLDLFALYGPVVNYHSVDKCFCEECTKYAKEALRLLIEKNLDSFSVHPSPITFIGYGNSDRDIGVAEGARSDRETGGEEEGPGGAYKTHPGRGMCRC